LIHYTLEYWNAPLLRFFVAVSLSSWLLVAAYFVKNSLSAQLPIYNPYAGYAKSIRPGS